MRKAACDGTCRAGLLALIASCVVLGGGTLYPPAGLRDEKNHRARDGTMEQRGADAGRSAVSRLKKPRTTATTSNALDGLTCRSAYTLGFNSSDEGAKRAEVASSEAAKRSCATASAVAFRPPTYAGMDYYGANDDSMPAPCNDGRWVWLQKRCWITAGGRERLQKDINYIRRQRLGKFHRVWVSLDQLFARWDASAGYRGFDRAALANAREMLRIFAKAGMQIDLVLFVQPEGPGLNGFHFEALDGNHPTMRANYLKAVRDFLLRVAADPLAAQAIAVVDLHNEVYFQTEAHLANEVRWNGSICSTSCLDTNVILPWVRDLYKTAKAAAPRFVYTASDTSRLLASPGAWQPMYPVDVYDIHLYEDEPWNDAAQYAESAATLTKPWFSGEVGCAPGHVECTYDGNNTQTQRVDGWFLDNLKKYGARAVLIESRATVFTREPYRLTAVGTLVQRHNAMRPLDSAKAESGPSLSSR